MFVNILVAIDGSTYAAKALDYAIEISERYDSKITLVHVVPTINGISAKLGSSKTMNLEDVEASLEDAGNEILEEGERTVKLAKIQAKTMLKHGDAADKIIEAAEETKADLIVVGERGLSAVSRFPLGSIAVKVSQHAKCPVLIIK